MSSFIRNSMLNFVLKNQKSFVILDVHKSSPAYNITFLQSNLQQLPNHYQQYFSTLPLQGESPKILNQYITQIQKNQQYLLNIQSQQIRPTILQDPIIKPISQIFRNLKLCLEQQVSNNLSKPTIRPQNISYLTGCVNIMQFQIWYKYIMYFSQQYENMSIAEKSQFMANLNCYLNKYSYIYTHRFALFKFIMRETHIQDLADFTFFFKLTQQPNLFRRRENQQGFGIQLQLLKNRIKIINKVSKSININQYAIKQQFIQIIPQLIENIQFFSLQDLLMLYQFYVKLSLDSSKLIETFQKSILERISKTQNSNLYTNIIKTSKILNIWRLQSRYNPQIMQQFIIPTINFSINQYKNGTVNNNLYMAHWNDIAYSLICCDYPKIQIAQQILNFVRFNNNKPKSKTYQISTQYIKFRKLKQKNYDFTKLLQKQLTQNKKNDHSVQPIQFNIVQKFWEGVIRKIVPQQHILKSKYISVFQIDILIKYKGQYFAVQVQGGHYRDPNNSSSQNGKKKIKKQILSSFGIKIITINCQEPTPKLIMRLNKKKDAQKYILEKLEQQTKQTKQTLVNKK